MSSSIVLQLAICLISFGTALSLPIGMRVLRVSLSSNANLLADEQTHPLIPRKGGGRGGGGGVFVGGSDPKKKRNKKIGIAVGVVGGVLLLAIILFVELRRRKRRHAAALNAPKGAIDAPINTKERSGNVWFGQSGLSGK